MKKHTIPTVAAAILAACATVPDKEAYLPAQGVACIEQRPIINGKPSTISWCIAAQMFQPRKYVVKIDGKSVFDGTDYTRVQFTSQADAGLVSGQCEEHVTLMDNKSNAPVAIASIPPTTVASCKIGSTQNGLSTRFLKSEECDAHFYKDLAPLIGPIMPVENLRRCTLDLNSTRVFDGTFNTARRF